MAVKSYTSTIEYKEEVARHTFRVGFRLPPGENIEYLPGQFITLLVAPNIRRSYSLSSVPSDKTLVETIADVEAGGPGSQFFINTKPGDQASFIGPLGSFVYKEDPKPAYFFATGTGLTPFISMIRFALEENKTTREIKLFSGFRYKEMIYAKEMLDNLKMSHSNFDYQFCISKPDPEWKGFCGRITPNAENISNTSIDAYICGAQEMIKDISGILKAKAVPEAQIYYEQFY